MKDNPDTNVHFVKMIERNPCVYNRRCREYSNKAKQDEIWREIGQKFDATVPECKERWKNLRACFTRHLKLKATPGYSAFHKKPYYLAQHLNFLRPFTKSRKQVGNISIPTSSSKHEVQEKQDFTNNFSENEQYNDESTIIDEINNPNVQDSSDTNLAQSNPRLSTSVAKKPAITTKRCCIDSEVVNEAIAKRFTKKKKTDTYDEDSDLCFFKSLLPDVRQMNPDQKRRFKVGVINLSGTILSEAVALWSDFHSVKKEFQDTERPNSESSTLSFNSLSQTCIIPPKTNDDYQKTEYFPKTRLPSDSSKQNNIFPLSISKQSIQPSPQEEVPSTSNCHGNLESRPSSPQSTSSNSSILEYKFNAEDLEESF